MLIQDLNPWWKTGKISKEYSDLDERLLFNKIKDYVNEKQIIVITGLRRVGKTVLMHHLINHLIKKIKPENVIYYSFDLAIKDIEEILEIYEKITNIDFKKEKIFIFLDEVQKLEDWQNKIKLIYDNYKNIKFFVSGSSSLFIEKRTKESLAGRSFSFKLAPLKFKEYLRLKNKSKFLKNITLYQKEIKKELKNYLKTGGFPELINETDELKIKRYIKELIIDKIIYIDIPEAFDIEEPSLLQSLIEIISSNPGIISDYENLANDLNRNRKTISNYISYLEKAFLIKKLYNFSKNLLTTEKKQKRFYPATTALANLYNADYGRIIETAILQNKDFKFFFRKANKEVDFINTEGDIFPVESKSGNKKDKINVLDFMKKFDSKEGLIITEDYEGKEKVEWFGTKKDIKFIPLWKWLLE